MGQKINPIALRVGISRSSDNLWYSSKNYAKLVHQTILMQSYIKVICKSLLYSSGRFFINYFPKKRNIFFCYSKFDTNNRNLNGMKPKHNLALDSYDKYKTSHTILSDCFIPYRTPKHLILLFLLITTKLSNSFFPKHSINQSIICLLFGLPQYIIANTNKTPLSISCLFEKNLSENVSIYQVPFSNSTISAQLLADELSNLIECKRSFKFGAKQIIRQIKKNSSIKGIRIACSGRLNGIEMARTDYKKYGQTSLHTIAAKIDYGFSEASTPYGIIGIKIWVCYY